MREEILEYLTTRRNVDYSVWAARTELRTGLDTAAVTTLQYDKGLRVLQDAGMQKYAAGISERAGYWRIITRQWNRFEADFLITVNPDLPPAVQQDIYLKKLENFYPAIEAADWHTLISQLPEYLDTREEKATELVKAAGKKKVIITTKNNNKRDDKN